VFSTKLMAFAREAVTEGEIDSAGDEITLVDLSSDDIAVGEANASAP
jgi:hypothetical protein